MQPFIDDKAAHPDHNVWAPGLVVTSIISEALAHTLDASRRFGDPDARGVIMRIQLPDGRMVRVQVTEDR